MVYPSKQKLSKEQMERVRQLARRLNLKAEELIREAQNSYEDIDEKMLDSEIERLSKKLSELTSVHAPLSSKIAAMTYKYHELYRSCGSYIIAILGLEAENKAICNLLGIKYDDSLRSKEEELFDRYHKS